MDYVCFDSKKKLYLKKVTKNTWGTTPLAEQATRVTHRSHFSKGLCQYAGTGGQWVILPVHNGQVLHSVSQQTSPEVVNATSTVPSVDVEEISKICETPRELDEEVTKLIARFNGTSGKFPTNAQAECEAHIKKLSEIDRMLVDINHYVEWVRADACTGYKIFHVQQMLQKKRRILKDKIVIYQAMLGATGADIFSGRALDDAVSGLEKRHYVPREIEKLFEKRKA